jgi:hypothetical protein
MPPVEMGTAGTFVVVAVGMDDEEAIANWNGMTVLGNAIGSGGIGFSCGNGWCGEDRGSWENTWDVVEINCSIDVCREVNADDNTAGERDAILKNQRRRNNQRTKEEDERSWLSWSKFVCNK